MNSYSVKNNELVSILIKIKLKLNKHIKMTTVFEGTIDGTVYNSQADYNKALRTKIKEGKGYSASYSMRTVPDDGDGELRPADEHACGCGCDGQCKSTGNCIDYVLPGFNSGQSFKDFLDSLSSDYQINNLNRDSFYEDMNRRFKTMMKAVDECKDAAELNDYLARIGCVTEVLSDMKDVNKAAIRKAISEFNDTRSKYDELMAKVHECEVNMELSRHNLDITQAVAENIECMESRYQDLSEHINCTINKLAGKCESGVDGGTSTIEGILTDSEKRELARTYPGLYRLLSQIFS